ncbi:hypothetical protein F9278_36340 [Streptomyces phaeolivaceus]|uniref:Uncharacterized protein n=1 Tax=Streptomyces phaeolivaceus TaxID=2653200 RepID=A0A5P8KCL3_9ACTN|nr:hypothetical protein [Streptomyces phaeolivaceus]QFR00747.1 hypothetical protein F9278_36340 [Streptomyces phaeolivaceus]
MNLTDTGAHIAVFLGGLAIATAFIGGLVLARRPRYQGPEPYAGFRTGARADSGSLVLLACEGHCDGDTAHETDGEDTATCVLCGTPRPVPAPDPA